MDSKEKSKINEQGEELNKDELEQATGGSHLKMQNSSDYFFADIEKVKHAKA